MVTYTRLLLYTVLSLSYGQVKLQDVHLTCPESDLFNGTQINLTCTVSTAYSTKCAAPVQEAEFRVSYDGNAYIPLCKVMDVSQCTFNENSEGCGCVENNKTHYTLKYTFIGTVSHNITWDCLINCLDDSLNPALTFESKFCKRRNVERIPAHTTEIFKDPSNGDQSLDTGLIIGIVVGVTVTVVAICVVVVLLFKEKIRSIFQGSDSATPKEKITNENLEKKETDKLLSVQAQEQTVSNENLEKKEFGDLPKPVQEQTESNEKQENKDD